MDLTTNGVVITDAVKFVQTNKDRLMSNKKEKDNERELDRNEYIDQLEEEQEGKKGEGTTNQVFRY